jgi:hypothetical protein
MTVPGAAPRQPGKTGNFIDSPLRPGRPGLRLRPQATI